MHVWSGATSWGCVQQWRKSGNLHQQKMGHCLQWHLGEQWSNGCLLSAWILTQWLAHLNTCTQEQLISSLDQHHTQGQCRIWEQNPTRILTPFSWMMLPVWEVRSHSWIAHMEEYVVFITVATQRMLVWDAKVYDIVTLCWWVNNRLWFEEKRFLNKMWRYMCISLKHWNPTKSSTQHIYAC